MPEDNSIETRYGWIEGENAHPKFELTGIGGRKYFLREAKDNQGGEITESMAWSIANQIANVWRAKGEAFNGVFCHHDRESGLWNTYQLSVGKDKEMHLTFTARQPQSVIDNEIQTSLAAKEEHARERER